MNAWANLHISGQPNTFLALGVADAAACWSCQDFLKAVRTGIEPTHPSAEAHCAATGVLNAVGPGYSAPAVKAEAAELQGLSLDAGSMAGFTAVSGVDLTAGSVTRPQQAAAPTTTTAETVIELLEGGVVVETAGRRVVYTAEPPDPAPKRRRPGYKLPQIEAAPERLALYRCRSLEILPDRLRSETAKHAGASCGVVFLPYAPGAARGLLGGLALVGHWLAFFCARGRLRFVDGHRARGDRVVASLADYAENASYSGEARYRLCE